MYGTCWNDARAGGLGCTPTSQISPTDTLGQLSQDVHPRDAGAHPPGARPLRHPRRGNRVRRPPRLGSGPARHIRSAHQASSFTRTLKSKSNMHIRKFTAPRLIPTTTPIVLCTHPSPRPKARRPRGQPPRVPLRSLSAVLTFSLPFVRTGPRPRPTPRPTP